MIEKDPNQNAIKSFSNPISKGVDDVIIDEYDKKMINYLGNLYSVINGEQISIDSLKSAVDALSAYNRREEYNYLESLLHPEKSKGTRIPAKMPVPSTSFQLHNSVTCTTNTSGNLLIVFNPYFLYNTGNWPNKMEDFDGNTYISNVNWMTSFYINNNSGLDGHTVLADSTFTPINIGQGIPGVYSQYRWVSASLIVKYIGRMDITSGVIGGAIVFDERRNLGGGGETKYNGSTYGNIYKMTGWGKYTNFDLAMDSFYHQENLSMQGIRELYFPWDNSYEEYVKLTDSSTVKIDWDRANWSNGFTLLADEDYYKSGFTQMVYVLGAPPSSACFKVDIYENFETLPSPEFWNYMPISPPVSTYIDQKAKQEAIAIIQQKPITKSDGSDTIVTKAPQSFWGILKNKFKGYLPSIKKLAIDGVMNWLPGGIKTGWTIAGNWLSKKRQKEIPFLGEENVE